MDQLHQNHASPSTRPRSAVNRGSKPVETSRKLIKASKPPRRVFNSGNASSGDGVVTIRDDEPLFAVATPLKEDETNQIGPDRGQTGTQMSLLSSMAANENEGEIAHRVSRYFIDRWLEEFGSTSEEVDPLSIQMLCRFDHYRIKYGETAETDQPSQGSQPEKNLACVGCEVLDELCAHLAKRFPVLQAIRSALYPCIFIEDSGPSSSYHLRRMWHEGRSNEELQEARADARNAKWRLEKLHESIEASEEEFTGLQDELDRQTGRLEEEQSKVELLRGQLDNSQANEVLYRQEHKRMKDDIDGVHQKVRAL